MIVQLVTKIINKRMEIANAKIRVAFLKAINALSAFRHVKRVKISTFVHHAFKDTHYKIKSVVLMEFLYCF